MERFLENQREEPEILTCDPNPFSYKRALLGLDDAIAGRSKPKFREVFEKFRVEKCAGTDSEICYKANLRQDTLSKLRMANVNPAREYLWALAIALTLNIDETEELFGSCGLSITGLDEREGEREEKRELALEYFIKNEIYNIKIINDALRERKYKVLGNFNPY